MYIYFQAFDSMLATYNQRYADADINFTSIEQMKSNLTTLKVPMVFLKTVLSQTL